MNPHEHELVYPWPDVPAAGTVHSLRPGLHWLRMPLPFALDHINLWLLDDEIAGRPGFTIIDCGIASDETKQAWESVFDTVLGGRPVLRVLATHFHPDHVGLAQWLTAGGARRRWSAPLWMTATEYAYARFLAAGSDDASGDGAARHFARHGLSDPAALAKVRARGGGYYPKLVPAVPGSYRRIMDGDGIAIGPHGAKRVFRVIVGHGHAPEHASLYCEDDRLLVSGDMVLPRISTNVSVFDLEPEADPLPRYLHSLDRYAALPADTLVLPSHGKPFIGLHQRIAQQHGHHRDRLAEVLAACAQPKTAAEIVPVLFKRELDLHQLTFALGEALAHLHALWHAGQVQRQEGNDGVFRFRAVAD
ncbi:MAG: MBL fold metallo-hydrolase [Burkholderiales bacterium]|nr:MBL fold metallo-hydrolase [Burkholderiales bacterium]